MGLVSLLNAERFQWSSSKLCPIFYSYFRGGEVTWRSTERTTACNEVVHGELKWSRCLTSPLLVCTRTVSYLASGTKICGNESWAAVILLSLLMKRNGWIAGFVRLYNFVRWSPARWFLCWFFWSTLCTLHFYFYQRNPGRKSARDGTCPAPWSWVRMKTLMAQTVVWFSKWLLGCILCAEAVR